MKTCSEALRRDSSLSCATGISFSLCRKKGNIKLELQTTAVRNDDAEKSNERKVNFVAAK